MRTLAFSALLLSSGCFGPHVYRSLSEPGAMRTCNANKQFQVSAPGFGPRNAERNALREAKKVVRRNGGCGVLVLREGFDTKNSVDYLTFQLCECHTLHF